MIEVEIVIDAGDTPRTYEVVATRAGRRVEVANRRGGVVEVSEVTRSGTAVRTARFMSSRILALVEHPADGQVRLTVHPGQIKARVGWRSSILPGFHFARLGLRFHPSPDPGGTETVRSARVPSRPGQTWAGRTWRTPSRRIRVSKDGCGAVAGPWTTAPSDNRKVLPCQGHTTQEVPSSETSFP